MVQSSLLQTLSPSVATEEVLQPSQGLRVLLMQHEGHSVMDRQVDEEEPE